MADSHPVMKALWVYQVEEVEHGSVAHDVYRALYGKHEWYRKYMVLMAGLHIARETVKAYVHMARIEGWLKNPLKAIGAMGFCFKTLGQMAWQNSARLQQKLQLAQSSAGFQQTGSGGHCMAATRCQRRQCARH